MTRAELELSSAYIPRCVCCKLSFAANPAQPFDCHAPGTLNEFHECSCSCNRSLLDAHAEECERSACVERAGG